MFCNMCGANIPDGVEFCPNCGAPQPKAAQPEAAQTEAAQAGAPQPGVPQPEAPAQAAAPVQPEAPQAGVPQPEVPAQPEQISAASTTPMMDIPIAEASDEMDPESGTTVLTFDMSGPLASESKPGGFEDATKDAPKVAPNSFNPQPEQQVQLEKPAQPAPVAEEKPEEHKHQLQTPEGKVSTPAPVTGSSILSDESVAPVTPTVQAQQYQAPNSVQQNNQQSYNQQNFNQQYVPAGNNVNNLNYGGNMGGNTEPLSTMSFLGWMLLYSCVPIVGLIFMFINAFGSDKNENLKNFTRAYLIIIAIAVAIEVIAWMIIAATGAAIMSGLDFIML